MWRSVIFHGGLNRPPRLYTICSIEAFFVRTMDQGWEGGSVRVWGQVQALGLLGGLLAVISPGFNAVNSEKCDQEIRR